jgi:hypothetical protein
LAHIAIGTGCPSLQYSPWREECHDMKSATLVRPNNPNRPAGSLAVRPLAEERIRFLQSYRDALLRELDGINAALSECPTRRYDSAEGAR